MSQFIGNYEILSELGRGGMGVVYKAFEPALNRAVALKMLNEGIAHQPGLVERFYREARAMATLSDPNVVQIYAVGEHQGQPYFVMEYIDGESLGGRLKRERLSVREARKLMAQAASGLQAAHERGLIHRDIKPGNLMLTQKGTVKVTDFGIALSEGSGERLTGTGGIVGTPGYLSPEACLGEPLDARTDIFALGVVFFEMLTGRLPFDDKSPYALMAAVVQAQIPDVTTLNSEIDPNTTQILGRMLARHPADRFQTCAELEAALNASANTSPLPPPRPAANTNTRPAPTPMPPSGPPAATVQRQAYVPPSAPPNYTPAPPSYTPAPPSYTPAPPSYTPAPPSYAPMHSAAPVVMMPPAKSSAMPWVLGGVGAMVVVGWMALSPSSNDVSKPDAPIPTETPSSSSDTTPASDDQSSASESSDSGQSQSSTSGAASSSEYSDFGTPNLALSELSPEDMVVAAQGVLGTYTGTLDKANFSLVLQSESGGEISGYNIADQTRRPVRGFVENFKEDIDADGDTWRVYSVVLHEPGDEENDGKFRIDLKHTDKYIAGEGSWTSYSGTQQFNIAIKNFTNKRD